MSHSREQMRKKAEAQRESTHHLRNGAVDKIRSNAELSDSELENRMMGREPGTSIIDQTTAGFALNNRKKASKGE